MDFISNIGGGYWFALWLAIGFTIWLVDLWVHTKGGKVMIDDPNYDQLKALVGAREAELMMVSVMMVTTTLLWPLTVFKIVRKRLKRMRDKR